VAKIEMEKPVPSIDRACRELLGNLRADRITADSDPGPDPDAVSVGGEGRGILELGDDAAHATGGDRSPTGMEESDPLTGNDVDRNAIGDCEPEG
jgi:hypothetical protein